jgi:nucleotide-binding universal stress UspA family protein
MVPTIRKIMYATDLSDNSRRAFIYAAGLAQRFDAKMLVVHVVEPINPNTYMQISSMMGESEWVNLQLDRNNQLIEEIMAKLRRFCLELQTDIDTSRLSDDNILVRKGLPVEEINSLAAEQGVDLIVLGTHGYGLVKDALMGGTVRRLVRQSTIPVLVVPNPEVDQDE